MLRPCLDAATWVGAGLVVTLAAGHADAQRPTVNLAKPHPYARQTDAGNQFIQVAAWSRSRRLDGRPLNGAETRIRREANVVPPADAAASYSFSVGASTTTGYWLQMGYLVLGSDGPNRPRWYVQVLDCRTAGAACTTVEWKLSRAGEAYVPPACSACSGDAGTGGYPFAFTSDAAGTWVEAASATVAYATQAGPATACPGTYGIQFLRLEWDSFVNASFNEVKAGSGVACTAPGQALWTSPATGP